MTAATSLDNAFSAAGGVKNPSAAKNSVYSQRLSAAMHENEILNQFSKIKGGII
jgi:hypothetical protein